MKGTDFFDPTSYHGTFNCHVPSGYFCLSIFWCLPPFPPVPFFCGSEGRRRPRWLRLSQSQRSRKMTVDYPPEDGPTGGTVADAAPSSLEAALRKPAARPSGVLSWLVGFGSGSPEPCKPVADSGPATDSERLAHQQQQAENSSPYSKLNDGIRNSSPNEVPRTPALGLRRSSSPADGTSVASSERSSRARTHLASLEQSDLDATPHSACISCVECGTGIAGAIFMLHDQPFCCQRHRLLAYHRGLGGGKGHSTQSPTLLQNMPENCKNVNGTGLLASYRSWL